MPILRSPGISGSLVLAFALGFVSALPIHAASSPAIGLFTDNGWDDPSLAQLKGIILTIDPGVQILDLAHTPAPLNLTEAAWLLDQCADEFPSGTIFVAEVDPKVGIEGNPVLLETGKGKFFVGPNAGLFTQVIAHEGFAKAWTLDKPELYRSNDVSRTFHGRDAWGFVAAHLAAGSDPEGIGTPLKTLVLLPNQEPTFSGGLLTTEALHIDRYGNVILNLPGTSELAAKLKDGNLVKISIGRESYSAPLVKSDGEVAKGRILLLYGASGLLEIGMNQGSAARQLKVEPGTPVYLKP